MRRVSGGVSSSKFSLRMLVFAVVPLVLFTSQREKMGEFVNPTWVKLLAWVTTAVIVALNVKLLLDFVGLTGGAGA